MSDLTLPYGAGYYAAGATADGPKVWADFAAIQTYINGANIDPTKLTASKTRVPLTFSNLAAVNTDTGSGGVDLQLGRFGFGSAITNYGTLKASCVAWQATASHGITDASVKLQRWTGAAWADVLTLYSGIPATNGAEDSAFSTHNQVLNGGTAYRLVVPAAAGQPTITNLSVTLDIEVSLR